MASDMDIRFSQDFSTSRYYVESSETIVMIPGGEIESQKDVSFSRLKGARPVGTEKTLPSYSCGVSNPKK